MASERYPKLSEKIHAERNWLRCKADWVAHAVELEQEIDEADALIAALKPECARFAANAVQEIATAELRGWESCKEAAARIVERSDDQRGVSRGDADRIRALQPPQPADEPTTSAGIVMLCREAVDFILRQLPDEQRSRILLKLGQMAPACVEACAINSSRAADEPKGAPLAKRYAVHICNFVGKRTGQCPPPRTKCELSSRASRCKKAVEYADFAWGVAALCAKHMDEECGPKPTEGASA